MSDEMTPEQASALLEQAQEQVENGEFDIDKPFDTKQSDQAQDEQIADDKGANEPKADSQDTNNNELDYVQLLAEERAQRIALQRQIEQLTKQEQPEQQSQEQQSQEQETNLSELFGDFDEVGISRAVEHIATQKAQQIVQQMLAEKLSPIEQQQRQAIQDEHINAINAVHPDANDIVNSNEFVEWVKAQPSYVIPNIVAVVENGTADQVNELLSNYKATLAPKTDPQQNDIKAKADKVIAETEPMIPNSLTDLGGAVATDPMTAIANMSGAEALEQMDGWTAEQIEAYLNRTI